MINHVNVLWSSHGFRDASLKMYVAGINLHFILIDGINFYKFSFIEDESYSDKKVKIIIFTLGIISLFAAYRVIEKCFVFVKFWLFRYLVILLDWLN